MPAWADKLPTLPVWIVKWFGVTGVNVITRISGIVLAALAAQYVLDGIQESGLLNR